jgi:hypothetical protein
MRNRYEYFKADEVMFAIPACTLHVTVGKEEEKRKEFYATILEYGEDNCEIVGKMLEWAERKGYPFEARFGPSSRLVGDIFYVEDERVELKLDFSGKREKIDDLVLYFTSNDSGYLETLLNLEKWTKTRKIPSFVRYVGIRGKIFQFRLWATTVFRGDPIRPIKRM